MARPAKEFNLKENQLKSLKAMASSELSSDKLKQRARVLLALHDKQEIKSLAQAESLSVYTIYGWRDNFVKDGMASLEDEARAGRGGAHMQNAKEQIRQYLLTCSDIEREQVTAETIANQFNVSQYVARTLLKEVDIAGQRKRQWDVGYNESPTPKNVDTLGLYLSSSCAIAVIATSENGMLPLMRGAVRTANKVIADDIQQFSSEKQECQITDLIRIASRQLGKQTVIHHYMSPEAFMEECILNRPNMFSTSYTVLRYSGQPIQSAALTTSGAKVQVTAYPDVKTWANSVDTIVNILQKGDTACSLSLATIANDFITASHEIDEPFIWMKHQSNVNVSTIAGESAPTDANSGQFLTTTYTLTSPTGSFSCAYRRKVEIPMPKDFDLTTLKFYKDLESLEQTVLNRSDILRFAEQYLEACACATEAKGISLTERMVEGEVGDLSVRIGGSLLSGLRGKEKLTSISFFRLASILVRDISYKKTAAVINYVTRRGESGSPLVSHTSLSDKIKSTAAKLGHYIEDWTGKTLEKFGFTAKKGRPKTGSSLPSSITDPQPYKGIDNYEQLYEKHLEKIHQYVAKYNETHLGDLAIKNMAMAEDVEMPGGRFVYVSPDDVEAKHQKIHRLNRETKYLGEKGGEKVQTTNVHVQVDEQWYAIAGKDMPTALKTTLAFLLENHLLEDRKLIVFSDGARTIKNWTNSLFSFASPKIIVDWPHFVKKSNEYFSMALYGGKANQERRGEIKRQFFGRVWVGNWKEAQQYLKEIAQDKTITRNVSELNRLYDYIERKSYGLTCFAVRRFMKVRLSSNRVEKLNDNDMSKRQKHNGMSWSHEGSLDLSTLSATFINHEEEHWFCDHELSFQLHDT